MSILKNNPKSAKPAMTEMRIISNLAMLIQQNGLELC